MFRDDDLALLTRPLYAFLTVAPKADRWPAPRPVWFEVTDGGDLQMFSVQGAPKLARLREQPRASVVVASPTGEPERWVAAEGPVTLHDDGGLELATRLAGRYYGPLDADQQKLLDDWRETGVVRIVLRPEKVSRFAI
ncbi:pyridoxamine 5'-phosphate oxidase family protein [Cryptosporangium phraense]|uniref:Pyridoxamine 5'-phosphate oxidase family protein n=1 Tax=Cryptosporangium phraense TaxID=2593070 RepID=A0A545AXU6_9ACTN|nr:pyridoxamine 5'-phosphate oxidase family protein [Cryptosporangium phraense]TQS46101.1 pyridoxamine 5'-phosphate oxidase family protein [Cryptosporangium phraense]